MATGDGEAVARLRVNAEQAGIQLREEDVARISAGGYFRNVEALRLLVTRVPSSTLPDYVRESLQAPNHRAPGAK